MSFPETIIHKANSVPSRILKQKLKTYNAPCVVIKEQIKKKLQECIKQAILNSLTE